MSAISACHFSLSDANPNDAAGFGGCLCSETRLTTQTGPFLVFYATETDCAQSPFPVICSGCVRGAYVKLASESITDAEVVDPFDCTPAIVAAAESAAKMLTTPAEIIAKASAKPKRAPAPVQTTQSAVDSTAIEAF